MTDRVTFNSVFSAPFLTVLISFCSPGYSRSLLEIGGVGTFPDRKVRMVHIVDILMFRTSFSVPYLIIWGSGMFLSGNNSEITGIIDQKVPINQEGRRDSPKER